MQIRNVFDDVMSLFQLQPVLYARTVQIRRGLCSSVLENR